MRYALAAMLTLSVVPTAAFAGEESRFEREDQKVGSSIGYQIGGDFRRQGLSVNPEMVIGGVLDALAGSESLMTEDEMERALVRLQGEARAAQERRRQELARRNLAEGAAFLARNANREGVRTLPSGLQYRIVKEGSGRIPSATDTVTVHYRGTLIDGTEFESSHGRGEPATFGIEGVIPGWSEALQLMRKGARWQLFVPPDLGYGERDSDLVGPNSTLIFEVELISVDTVE
jgi:FKBP-type peptidyl-prolyl cis-trans isomerase FklB